MGGLQRVIDGGENPTEVSVDIIVPEAEHAKSLTFEMMVTLHIAFGMSVFVMLPAIDFDDQSMLEADKIQDSVVTWRLSPKMKSARSPGAEMDPKLDLLWRQSLPQFPRCLVCH